MYLIHEYNLIELILERKEKKQEFLEFQKDIEKEGFNLKDCVIAKTDFNYDKKDYSYIIGIVIDKDESKKINVNIFEIPFLKKWCEKVFEKQSNLNFKEIIKDIKKPNITTISYDDSSDIISWNSTIDVKITKVKL